jgi:hypothetical protein
VKLHDKQPETLCVAVIDRIKLLNVVKDQSGAVVPGASVTPLGIFEVTQSVTLVCLRCSFQKQKERPASFSSGVDA